MSPYGKTPLLQSTSDNAMVAIDYEAALPSHREGVYCSETSDYLEQLQSKLIKPPHELMIKVCFPEDIGPVQHDDLNTFLRDVQKVCFYKFS